MSTYSAVKGLCYLEPKRHICHVTDLDGREASEFGPVLSKTTRAIKYATGSKVIYVYIFGDHIPHLHVHLAPHIDGDVYYDDVIRKDVEINDDTISPVDLKKIRSSILLFMKQESQ
ncbi:hypothetical protein ApAK_07885 [Thermoplasmatales archaeon AK]|nr:hypothetical protein [Thermoplasmatales archaeon AK]